MKENRVLTIDNLTTTFESHKQKIQAVRGVSLHVDEGDILAIVGESGSGKSVTMKSVMGLLGENADVQADHLELLQKDLLSMSEKEKRKMRGKDMAMIFQDPMTALNPTMRIGRQISEVVSAHRNISKEEAEIEGKRMLELVGIPAERYNEFPHQFSGGMKQRVVIAIALACNPELLLADEPTTALDVTVQAQVLELLKDLQKKLNTAILLITHNLGVVWEMCDTVMVMYAGNTVEYADTKTLYKEPLHPYTWGLLDSMPKLSSSTKEDLKTIPGTPPDLRLTGHCCNFYNRCPYATEICKNQVPPLKEVAPGHFVACHRQDGEHRLTRGEVNETCRKM